jgi:hypothetical protein
MLIVRVRVPPRGLGGRAKRSPSAPLSRWERAGVRAECGHRRGLRPRCARGGSAGGSWHEPPNPSERAIAGRLPGVRRSPRSGTSGNGSGLGDGAGLRPAPPGGELNRSQRRERRTEKPRRAGHGSARARVEREGERGRRRGELTWPSSPRRAASAAPRLRRAERRWNGRINEAAPARGVVTCPAGGASRDWAARLRAPRGVTVEVASGGRERFAPAHQVSYCPSPGRELRSCRSSFVEVVGWCRVRCFWRCACFWG